MKPYSAGTPSTMLEVINLALPFFGLIFLGFACGKVKTIPETGLAWMNFFIINVALPCLFYRIVAATPLEQLNKPSYVVATSLATFCAFGIAYLVTLLIRRGRMAEATIGALAGGYGNIGYMGPGLALSTLGPATSAPVALIFCFDTILLFSLVPMLMAVAGNAKKGVLANVLEVLRKIVLNPFIVATMLGVVSAALHWQPPVALDRLMQFLQNAAAPCALFTLGVTVALRPVKRIPWEVPPLIAIKLLVHPVLAFAIVSLFGGFAIEWVHAAVLMAALPPALNVFVISRQYDTWVEQASSSVLFGTLFSMLTLTSVMWLVKTGNLPGTLFP